MSTDNTPEPPESERVGPKSITGIGTGLDGVKGTLTQWILAQKLPNSINSVDGLTSSFCPKCGLKRREQKQLGSLTHWIFQSHFCQCEAIKPALTESEEVELVKMHGFATDLIMHSYAEESEQVEAPPDFPVERFRFVREIAHGANGTVYAAIDRLLEKLVAIKLLKGFEEKECISFQNEARAIARLQHPNIVKILDFSVSESGAPYLVMEYITGKTLRDWLNESGVIEQHEVLRLFTPVVEAMAHVHEKGIFHRDLKPDNLLVVEHGGEPIVKIIDFGLSIVKNETMYQTGSGERLIAGTPQYMSPDLFRGLPFSRSSEVYSIGTVLFEVLTGRIPYSGENPLELMVRKTEEPPPGFAEVASNTVSDELQMIVTRCLAIEPAARFQSMDELKDALILLCTDEQVQSAPSNSSSVPARSGLERSLPEGSMLWSKTLVFPVVALVSVLVIILIIVSPPKPLSVDVSESALPEHTPAAADVFREPDSSLETPRKPGVLTRMYGDNVLHLEDVLVTVRDIGNASKVDALRALELVNCRVDQNVIDAICTMSELRHLKVYGTSLKGLSIGALAHLNKLEGLHLSDTGVDRSILRMLPGLRRLERLWLANLDLCDRDIKWIEACSSLQVVSLSYNPRITISGLMRLSKLKRLRRLCCYNIPLTAKETVRLRRAMPGVRLDLSRSLNGELAQ